MATNATNTYKDMVNSRSFLDDIGDAFTRQSMQPAKNGNQRLANAAMSGLGGGLNAAASKDRSSRLKDLEEANKNLAMIETQAQAAIGEDTYRKAAFANFATTKYSLFKGMAEAKKAGAQKEFSDMTVAAVNEFAKAYPDLAEGMGKVEFAYGGKIYFNEDGQSIGHDMGEVLAPLIATLPEDQQKELQELTTGAMRDKFRKSELFENAKLNEINAHTNNMYADSNLKNQHANLYAAEANKAAGIEGQKYDEKTLQYIRKENIDWVNKSKDIIDTKKRVANAYSKIADIITNEMGKPMGRAGVGAWTQLQRLVDIADSGSSLSQSQMDLEVAKLMPQMKEIFVGVATDNDLKTFIKGLPTLEKDPRAAVAAAKEQAKYIKDNIWDLETRANVLQNDFKYSEPYNSQIVSEKVNSLKPKQEENTQEALPVIDSKGVSGNYTKQIIDMALEAGILVKQ